LFDADVPWGELMPSSKRFFAPLIVMFGLIIAVVAFAGPSSAYPPGTLPTTSVSNQTPTAGSSVTFCGSGFQPGETVTIALGTTAKPSVVADSSGAFCTTVVLGATLTGTQTLTATGTTSGSTSSLQIRVAGVSASIGALGGLLLVGGAIMVLASRRRKANA
jgi:hypothetical protein